MSKGGRVASNRPSPRESETRRQQMASKYDNMSYLDLINEADAKAIAIRKGGETLDADAIRAKLKKPVKGQAGDEA